MPEAQLPNHIEARLDEFAPWEELHDIGETIDFGGFINPADLDLDLDLEELGS